MSANLASQFGWLLTTRYLIRRFLSLVRRWQTSLAADRLKVVSWFQGQESANRRNKSADEMAYEGGINRLPLTSAMVIRLSEVDTQPKARLGLRRKFVWIRLLCHSFA